MKSTGEQNSGNYLMGMSPFLESGILITLATLMREENGSSNANQSDRPNGIAPDHA